MKSYLPIASREEDQNTDAEIEKAHVIILVYDVNNMESIKRLKSHWFQRILRINDKVSALDQTMKDPDPPSWQQSRLEVFSA